MRNKSRKISLGEILTKVDRYINIEPQETYREITVKLWGKGLSRRRDVSGTQIAAKRRIQVKSGEFIVSRIDARHGAFGLIPDSLDGAVVSNDFPVFTINSSLILSKYLYWLSKTCHFIELCKKASEGTTNRVRLKEDKFLANKIHLPPLSEQVRIISKIDELFGKINEAYHLKLTSLSETEAMISSVRESIFKPKKGWKFQKIHEFCEKPQYGYTASADYENVGPKLLRITDIQDGRVNWDSVPYCLCPDPEKYLLKKNDLVFTRTGATTGKSFLIRQCPTAVFASYLIRLRVKNIVNVKYIYQYFQSPSYWSQILDKAKGTGQPNFNGKKLSNLKVPIPPFKEQEEIVSYIENFESKVDSLKKLQFKTQTELNAMLPSILDKAFNRDL